MYPPYDWIKVNATAAECVSMSVHMPYLQWRPKEQRLLIRMLVWNAAPAELIARWGR